MTPSVSLYLDVIRFLAAVSVFSVHVSWPPLAGYHFLALPAFLDLGSQAVDIFFVLSGFVIGFVVDSREGTARLYAIRRLGRLYSVVVPALAATMILDLLGNWVRPELYATVREAAEGIGVWRYSASALFVNEIWWFNVVPGVNLPFWSLGYEAWYYLIFGIVHFAPKRLRWVGVSCALLVAGPKIAALFPLWLSGVLCYRICTRSRVEVVGASGLWILSIVGLFYYQVLYMYLHIHNMAPRPILYRSVEMWNDYVIGALFISNIVGFRFGFFGIIFGKFVKIFSRPIRLVAGTTFTLYLLHYPVMFFIGSLAPWPPSSWQNRSAIVFGTFAIVFMAAEFTERRKVMWQRIVGWCFDRLAKYYTHLYNTKMPRQAP